jgi:hypothetical protein
VILLWFPPGVISTRRAVFLVAFSTQQSAVSLSWFTRQLRESSNVFKKDWLIADG